ncbi:hypothetical protein F5B19DRAFT_498884 [Rostrohypoxylon terebratum]|nr:hypothetical protein F5B19DRAFT_498884 [Rostrohypoxylon terebratum]
MASFRNWRTTDLPLPDADDNATPNHPGAAGWVSVDGKFMCECGSVMRNDNHCISSHLTKKHKSDSAYQRTQFKAAGAVWSCPDCESGHENWNALLAHYRRQHAFRGDSSKKREQTDPFKPASSLDAAFAAFITRALSRNQNR